MGRDEYAVFLLYGRILGVGARPKWCDGDPPVRQAAYAVMVPGRFTSTILERLDAASKGRGPRVVLRQGGPETRTDGCARQDDGASGKLGLDIR